MKGFASFFLITFFSLAGHAAPADSDKNPPANVYVSEVDKSITVHKVGILPSTDNVSGLYTRYTEDKLADLIKSSHRFDLASVKDVDARKTLEDYEGDPNLVKSLGEKNHVDALVGERVSKTAKGIELTLDLFLTSDGKLFAQETEANESKFSTADVENKTAELYSRAVGKLPYKGLILSRQGNRVTLDIGTKDGIKDGIVVSVEQVIALKRHPRFHFILASEKEIIGKVKVIKADETLSFGTVLSEKERGIVTTDSKITGLDFVTYADPSAPATTPSLQPTTTNDFSKEAVSFGKHPREWLPPKQPSLGKVGIGLGLGSFHDAMNVNNNSITGDAAIYPQIDLSGEIWLTTNWFADAEINQGVMSLGNLPAGSSQSSVGANNAHYDLHGGYKVLLQDDFWGPTIDLLMGIARYSFSVDNASPLTSYSYGGLYLGLGGSAPLTPERNWYLDAKLNYFLFPSMTETPGTSGGTASNSVTQFSVGASYKLQTQFWIKGHMNFEVYESRFSDTGNTARQQLITFLTGIDYLF